jgi:hypothetical protein
MLSALVSPGENGLGDVYKRKLGANVHFVIELTLKTLRSTTSMATVANTMNAI